VSFEVIVLFCSFHLRPICMRALLLYI